MNYLQIVQGVQYDSLMEYLIVPYITILKNSQSIVVIKVHS